MIFLGIHQVQNGRKQIKFLKKNNDLHSAFSTAIDKKDIKNDIYLHSGSGNAMELSVICLHSTSQNAMQEH